MTSESLKKPNISDTKSWFGRLRKDLIKHKYIYFMAIPVLAYYVIFHYMPMYGNVMAFQDFRAGLGIGGSRWVGFQHFRDFFQSFFFWRLIRNTLLINVYSLIFAFPAPIIFAILLNEIRLKKFKRTVQTVSYLPHFVSVVIISGLIVNFTGTDGLINNIIEMFGGERSNLLARPELFRTIFISSNIWTGLGWSSIVYLGALTTIDPTLYEAATIDGAGRFRRIWHITLPGIQPTIVILLIFTIGNMLSVGWERILLMYNPIIFETADVISTYVFRRGVQQSDFSFATAIGLFNSVVNFALLIVANTVIRKLNETSLW